MRRFYLRAVFTTLLVLCIANICIADAAEDASLNSGTLQVAVLDCAGFVDVNKDHSLTHYAMQMMRDIELSTDLECQPTPMNYADIRAAIANNAVDVAVCMPREPGYVSSDYAADASAVPGGANTGSPGGTIGDANQPDSSTSAGIIYSAAPVSMDGLLMCTLASNHQLALNDFEGMADMRFGFVRTDYAASALPELMRSNQIQAEAVEYDSRAALLAALEQREIDAFLEHYLNYTGEYLIIANLGSTPLYFAVSAERPELLQQLDEAITELSVTNPYYVYDALCGNFNDISYNEAFTRNELEYIAQHSPLRIGLQAGCSPFSTRNQDGSFSGIAPELMELISQNTGLEFEYVLVPATGNVDAAMRDCRVEALLPVLNSVFADVSNFEFLIDTDVDTSLVLLAQANAEFSPEAECILAIPGNTMLSEANVRKYFPNADTRVLANLDECFRALQRGEVDVAIGNVNMANELLHNIDYGNIAILPAYSFGEDMEIALSGAADASLVSIIKKSVNSVSAAQRIQLELSNANSATYLPSLNDLLRKYWLRILAVIIMIVGTLGGLLFWHCTARRFATTNAHLLDALRERDKAAEQRNTLAAQRECDEQYKLELKKLADHDELTGLYTKRAFYSATREMIDAHPEIRFAILRGDVDNFKVFNDVFGLSAGDEVLRGIAKIVKSFQASLYTCGYLGSDHFAGCCPLAELDIESIAKDITSYLNTCQAPFKCSFTLGIYVIDEPDVPIALMCDRALLAASTVKGEYGTSYAFYNAEMREKLVQEQRISSKMADALRNHEFEVYLMPVNDYNEARIVSAEALVRWKHPEHGMISPAVFIPIFEKNGFIRELDAYVWERACQYLRAWLDNPAITPVPIAVNVSRMDLYNPDLCADFIELITRYKLPADMLRMEITESAYSQDPAILIKAVRELQAAGFIVEMDDFGSGYSSLNMLKDVPVDVLKLDLAFLRGENSERGGNILSSVVRMARWLNLAVIAEGVETERYAEYLGSIGCSLMQGYYFYRPMPRADFERLLVEGSACNVNPARYFGLVDLNKFWDPNAQNELLFNSFVGGAAICEYAGGHFEAVRLNDKFTRELGTTRAAYKRYMRDILTRVTPDDRPEFVAMLQRAIDTGEEDECEIRSLPVNESGRQFWVHTRVRVIARTHQRYLFYVAIENVDEKRRLSEQLNAIMNSIPGGIALYELKGDALKMLFFTERVAAISGYTHEEYTDAGFDIDPQALIYPPDMENVLHQVHCLALNTISTLDHTFRILHKDGGYRWVRIYAGVMRRDTVAIQIAAVIQDVTYQRQFGRLTQMQHVALDTFYDAMPCGIVVYTLEDNPRLAICNRAARNILSIDGADSHLTDYLTGKASHLPEQYMEEWRTSAKTYMEDPASTRAEKFDRMVKRRDGTSICLHGIRQPIKLPSGMDEYGQNIEERAVQIMFVTDAANVFYDYASNAYNGECMLDILFEQNYMINTANMTVYPMCNRPCSLENSPLSDAGATNIEPVTWLFSRICASGDWPVFESALEHICARPTGAAYTLSLHRPAESRAAGSLLCTLLHVTDTRVACLFRSEPTAALMRPADTLAQSEHAYRAICEYVGLAIFEWNVRYGVNRVSPAFDAYAASTYPLSQLANAELAAQLVLPEDIAALDLVRPAPGTCAGVHETTVRLKLRDGSFQLTRLHIQYVCDAEGTLDRVIGALLPLEPNLSTIDVREMSRRINDITNRLSFGVAQFEVIGSKGEKCALHTVYLSEQAYALFQIPRDTNAFARVESMLNTPEMHAALKAALLADAPTEFTTSTHNQSGPRWLRLRIRIVNLNDARRLCYMTVCDSTEQANAQAQQQWQNERYLQLLNVLHVLVLDYQVDTDVLAYSVSLPQLGQKTGEVPAFLDALNSDDNRDLAIHPESRVVCRELINRTISLNDNTISELRINVLGTGYRWYNVTCAGMRNERGRVCSMLCRADENQRRHEDAELINSGLGERGAPGMDERELLQERIECMLSETGHSVVLAVIDMGEPGQSGGGSDAAQGIEAVCELRDMRPDVMGEVSESEWVAVFKDYSIEEALGWIKAVRQEMEKRGGGGTV